MKYGTVAGIEQPVARIVMGSMVCHMDTLDLTREVLDAYVAAGGNIIDTAHIYGGGQCERAIGVWLKERGNRDSILILDKGAHTGPAGPRVTPEDIDSDISESLERLGTDYIDLYLLHRDNPEVPVGPIVDCLNRHRDAGRIRAFGGSNWTTRRIDDANAYALAQGLTGFVASSPHLSLARQNVAPWSGCVELDKDGIEWHRAKQFPLFPWSSQAGGFFTGKFAPDDGNTGDMARIYYSEDNWERLRRARKLAAAKGSTSTAVALAYVLCQPFPVFALIGPRSVAELDSSLPALDLELTESELRWLNLEA